MPKNTYLKCESSEGMFSFERAVSVKDINGNEKSGFFQKEYFYDDKYDKLIVQICEIRGDKMLVYCRHQNCCGFGFLAESKIWVHKSQIVELD